MLSRAVFCCIGVIGIRQVQLAEKKRNKLSKRNETLSQFRKDESGKYVYAGRFMKTQDPAETAGKKNMMMAAAAALTAVLSIAAGCLPDTGMGGTFYLLLPYAAGLILDFLNIWTVFRVICARGRLRSYIYEKTVRVLPGRGALRCVLGFAGLFGYLICRIRGIYSGSGPGEIIYILSQAAGAAGGAILSRVAVKYCWIPDRTGGG